MRLILALALLPLPAAAWEFSPDPMCTLTHQAEDAEIAITYDSAVPQYTLFITLRSGEWPDAAGFQMIFGGGRDVTIGTTLHSLSADSATLTVRDSGFGNVLDGLEFNDTVVSTSGATTVIADLSDAAPAVQAFRACPSDLPATS
jgi:hypothetical protein